MGGRLEVVLGGAWRRVRGGGRAVRLRGLKLLIIRMRLVHTFVCMFGVVCIHVLDIDQITHQFTSLTKQEEAYLREAIKASLEDDKKIKGDNAGGNKPALSAEATDLLIDFMDDFDATG